MNERDEIERILKKHSVYVEGKDKTHIKQSAYRELVSDLLTLMHRDVSEMIEESAEDYMAHLFEGLDGAISELSIMSKDCLDRANKWDKNKESEDGL